MQQSRIFILTDGQVSNRDQVIQQARECRDTSRIFTFGIGSGADEVLVQETAKSGRGCSFMVSDGSTDLKGKVVSALKYAAEPSLADC